MGRLKSAWVCVVLAGAGVAGAGRALGARHSVLRPRGSAGGALLDPAPWRGYDTAP
jgi:hypothetical protein